MFNFFEKETPALARECGKTWMEYLHRTSVPFLSKKSSDGDNGGGKGGGTGGGIGGKKREKKKS